MNDKPDDKTETPKFINAKRRGFLQGAAVATGAAAGGVAVAASSIAEDDSQPAIEPVADNKGYELTDHVKKYYRRARF